MTALDGRFQVEGSLISITSFLRAKGVSKTVIVEEILSIRGQSNIQTVLVSADMR